MANELRTANDVRRFLYAGDAVLTLESRKTGKHFTYRVSRAEGRDGEPVDRWFASILADGDRWVYAAMIYPAERGKLHTTVSTKASKFSCDAPSRRALDFLLGQMQAKTVEPVHADLVVRHEGRCGRCRRPLTRPDSIDRGIGPECAEIMGLTDGA
jgi:hypothetical protein